MPHPRLTRSDLVGKVIDAHTHAGVALGSYARAEYPYAQTIEGLYRQQRQGGVDVNIVFPFTSDLHFDLPRLAAGEYRKARGAVSPTPFEVENRLLLREVFEYCPEWSARFLPFVSVDPVRETQAQLRALRALCGEYPVYGIKINPVISQAPVTALLKEGRGLLRFAERRQLPVLLHTSSLKTDLYAYAGKAFQVIEAHPRIRFCLAHCILFSRPFLDRALAAPNVWVDTAAFKIQVDLCRDLVRQGGLDPRDMVEAEYDDPDSVHAAMCRRYGERLLWGTDSPAFAYICRRRLTRAQWQRFGYKGTYEDEVRLLRNRPPAVRRRITGENTLQFLFGSQPTGAEGATT